MARPKIERVCTTCGRYVPVGQGVWVQEAYALWFVHNAYPCVGEEDELLKSEADLPTD